MRSSALLWVLAGILFVWGVWGYDVWAPDEPYFAEGAREMIADGRWIVPHVNGHVTTDKPPMFFWSIAVSSLPFGTVTPFSARLPSILAALGSLFLTMRLARRFWNERVALYAGGLLTASYMFWEKARSAQTDALLGFFILLAISAFEAYRSGDTDGRRAGILFWVAMGLAVLTKGPIGLLLPLGIAVLTLVFDRDLKRWLGFAPLLGPLALVAVLAAWIVPANLWDPEKYTVAVAFREHFVDRAIHGMHHAQPWWYYAKVLPPQLMPLTPLVPGAILLAFRRRDPADRLLLVMIFFVLLVFSISTEKRTLYALPSYPAYALLTASLLESVFKGSAGKMSERWVSVPQWISTALYLLVGAGLIYASGRVDQVPSWMVQALGAVFIGTALAIGANLVRKAWPASVAAACVGTIVAYLFVSTWVYPALDPVKSSREFSQTLRAETVATRQAGRDVVSFRLLNLPEAFSFHSKGVYTLETKSTAVLAEHLRQPYRAWAVVDTEFTQLLPSDVEERIVTVATARLSRINVALVHNGAESD